LTLLPLHEWLGDSVVDVPSGLRYTKEHEWVRVEGNEVSIGITDFAQNALTEVVWVELPEVDLVVEVMESFASVESVKSVSEIYAPVAGTVIEINESLEDAPEQINEDPYGEGWICKIKTNADVDVSDLLDPESYSALIGD
jgi:glycine cleavage system H protein|tara:strand:- start:3099 stop:3521 length:423 start_codon:yes stop_codon:yes gene_type:complete